MLIWSITQQEKTKLRHSYQLYNIKGIGNLVEFSEEVLGEFSAKDGEEFYFLDSVEELDENTLIPLFVSNATLVERYPMIPILQDYYRLVSNTWNSSFIRALSLTIKLQNPMPSKKPRRIPNIFINRVGVFHAPTGSLLRTIDNMLSSGFPQEHIELFLTTVVSKEKIFHSKTIQIIEKLLEISDLLWRNHYVTKR